MKKIKSAGHGITNISTDIIIVIVFLI